MNKHQIEAQAKLVSERLGVEAQAVAAVLTEYWSEQIAEVWTIEDVQSLRESLTDEEAIAVLHHVDETHDANIGINWNSIEASIQALYG